MIIILFIFLLLTVALVGRNIALNQSSSDQKLEMLMKEDFQKENGQDDAVKQGEQCLYLWDSRDENSRCFMIRCHRFSRICGWIIRKATRLRGNSDL